MNTWRRLFVDVRASLRGVVDELENHEAAAESALRRLETVRARTALQASQLRRQRDGLEHKLESLGEEGRCWRERAVRVGGTDKERGRECVRRLGAVEAKQESIRVEIQRTGALLEKVSGDLQAMDVRLGELRASKAAFVARENRAESTLVFDASCQGDSSAEAILERWERHIAMNEARIDSGPDWESDRFATAFKSEEAARDTDARLDALLTEAAGADEASTDSTPREGQS